jgi:hypothetical protein
MTDVLPAARYFSLFFFKRPKTEHHVYFFIYIYECLSMNTITNEIASAETISGTTAPYVPSSISSATARREGSISSISSATRDTARTCSIWPEGDDTTTSSTWFLAPASSKSHTVSPVWNYFAYFDLGRHPGIALTSAFRQRSTTVNTTLPHRSLII